MKISKCNDISVAYKFLDFPLLLEITEEWEILTKTRWVGKIYKDGESYKLRQIKSQRCFKSNSQNLTGIYFVYNQIKNAISPDFLPNNLTLKYNIRKQHYF